jgi:hypothetical protein
MSALSLPPGVDRTKVRFLTPDMCRIHLGNHGALHVTVKDERIYGGVFAAYAFPVAHPEGYVSLLHAIDEKEEFEIGVIRDLKDFPPSDADLVRAALRQRYFVHTITRLKWIGWEYGYICLDVETDKGPARFYVRWATDRAVDYGRRGKVMLDVDDNRYLIPDLDKLTPKERSEFTRFIYW